MNEMVNPIIGGLLIGFSAALLLWSIGRVAGISGILWQGVKEGLNDQAWRIMFLFGLVLGPLMLITLGSHEIPKVNDMGWPMVVLSGVLVGLGTRMGSGCTSGHGICGIARFSKRSIVATLVFMAVGILTVTLVRHVL